MPQLEELDLGGYYQHRLTADTLAPLTQLRVLGVSGKARQPIDAGVLLLFLQRLVVVGDTQEVVGKLVPLSVRYERLVVDVVDSALGLGGYGEYGRGLQRE